MIVDYYLYHTCVQKCWANVRWEIMLFIGKPKGKSRMISDMYVVYAKGRGRQQTHQRSSHQRPGSPRIGSKTSEKAEVGAQERQTARCRKESRCTKRTSSGAWSLYITRILMLLHMWYMVGICCSWIYKYIDIRTAQSLFRKNSYLVTNTPTGRIHIRISRAATRMTIIQGTCLRSLPNTTPNMRLVTSTAAPWAR